MSPIVEHEGTAEPRAVCYRCHKPRVTCICDRVEPVHNQIPVWICQHPRERFHPFGTARIAQLGLEKVHLEVVHPRSASVPRSLPAQAGVLYPGAGARDLARLRPDERPEGLIVIDGTWAQARTLYRDKPWLQRLPCYRLTPPTESRYRLRKEPAAECVSTIEAIVEALRILEPDTPGLDDLLASFDSMIDQQLELIDRHRRGRRKPAVARSRCGVPLPFVDELERLVVVGFEAAPRTDRKHNSFAIIQCVALRFATGESFQRFVQPPAERFPSRHHLGHMGLSAELLAAGTSPEALRNEWERFVAPEDIVVAWNTSVLQALGAALLLPERHLHLKSAYRSHAKHAQGSLRAVIEQLRLEAPALPELQGRAGRHVARVAALLAYLLSDSGRCR